MIIPELLDQELLDTTRSYLIERNSRLVNDFIATLDWAMAPRRLDPRSLPCVAHLSNVLTHVGETERALVRLIVENAQSLSWGQTYRAEDFGEAFLRNYGWMELFGTRGHFVNDRFAGGFLLLGPHIDYPNHHHIAEEIYIPLTGGAEWRAGDTGFRKRAAGEVIHHPSNIVHAIRTGDAPLLAFYLWRGGPLDQRSTIGGRMEKA